jgi:hypothetical protein
MIPTLQFKVDFSPILKQLAQGEVRAVIYNDARSVRNFPYFWSVNDGHDPIVPKFAKVLRFLPAGRNLGELMSGRTIGAMAGERLTAPGSERVAGAIFARRVRSTKPGQRIRERAVEAIMPTLHSMARHSSGSRAGLVAFANEAAALAKHALIQFTPHRSGTLASKYRIDYAK